MSSKSTNIFSKYQGWPDNLPFSISGIRPDNGFWFAGYVTRLDTRYIFFVLRFFLTLLEFNVCITWTLIKIIMLTSVSSRSRNSRNKECMHKNYFWYEIIKLLIKIRPDTRHEIWFLKNYTTSSLVNMHAVLLYVVI